MELQSISLGVKEHQWIVKSRWVFYSFAVNDANISPFKWKLARVDGGFLCVQGGVFLCDFLSLFSIDLVRFLVWHRTQISLEQTNKKKKPVKKTSYASLTEFYPINSSPYYSLSNAWISSEYFESLFLRQ